MGHETHVLVVEDDDQTRTLLASVLIEAGYHVSQASDGETAMILLSEDKIDVVLTDLKLREASGIDVLAATRARPLPPEVILLTGFASLETAIAALRAGAFDYLLKPIASTELLERVALAARQRSASLRRVAALQLLAEEMDMPTLSASLGDKARRTVGLDQDRYKSIGRLQLDMFRRIASFDGFQLHLTPIEFALIGCLAETPGQVVTSSEIVRRTHGYDAPLPEAQALLRGHVRNLRRKIPDGYLLTVRGSGYMLVIPEEE